jgi:hypothetical protein
MGRFEERDKMVEKQVDLGIWRCCITGNMSNMELKPFNCVRGPGKDLWHLPTGAVNINVDSKKLREGGEHESITVGARQTHALDIFVSVEIIFC